MLVGHTDGYTDGGEWSLCNDPQGLCSKALNQAIQAGGPLPQKHHQDCQGLLNNLKEDIIVMMCCTPAMKSGEENKRPEDWVQPPGVTKKLDGSEAYKKEIDNFAMTAKNVLDTPMRGRMMEKIEGMPPLTRAEYLAQGLSVDTAAAWQSVYSDLLEVAPYGAPPGDFAHCWTGPWNDTFWRWFHGTYQQEGRRANWLLTYYNLAIESGTKFVEETVNFFLGSTGVKPRVEGDVIEKMTIITHRWQELAEKVMSVQRNFSQVDDLIHYLRAGLVAAEVNAWYASTLEWLKTHCGALFSANETSAALFGLIEYCRLNSDRDQDLLEFCRSAFGDDSDFTKRAHGLLAPDVERDKFLTDLREEVFRYAGVLENALTDLMSLAESSSIYTHPDLSGLAHAQFEWVYDQLNNHIYPQFKKEIKNERARMSTAIDDPDDDPGDNDDGADRPRGYDSDSDTEHPTLQAAAQFADAYNRRNANSGRYDSDSEGDNYRSDSDSEGGNYRSDSD